MQYTDEQSLYFRKVLGEVLKELREKNTNLSCNKFCDEYGLNDSNLGKIERAIIDCKFITLWKIIESMGIDFAEFVCLFKERLGKDFTFIDE